MHVADRLIEELYAVQLDLGDVVTCQHAANTWSRESLAEVETNDAPAGDRRPDEHGVEHAGRALVRGVSRAAGDLLERIGARHTRSDHVHRHVLDPRLRIEGW